MDEITKVGRLKVNSDFFIFFFFLTRLKEELCRFLIKKLDPVNDKFISAL